MALHFRGILELSRILFNVYKMADMLQLISLFVRPFPLTIVSRVLSFFPLPNLPTTRTGHCGGERHKLKAALRLYADDSYRRILAQQSVTRLRHALNTRQMVCSLSQSFLSYLLLWSFALTVPGVISKVLSNLSNVNSHITR